MVHNYFIWWWVLMFHNYFIWWWVLMVHNYCFNIVLCGNRVEDHKLNRMIISSTSLSHILLQYVRLCISNNSYKSVLVICPLRGKYPYFIFPHISVFAPEFNFRYLRSGLKDYMSKYQERWCIKICRTNEHIAAKYVIMKLNW
jgi:hypothetical protein